MAEVSAVVASEVEVAEKAARRQFKAEYKRKILKEADACTREGEIGALLRREGLYSSHLAVWRAARQRGEIAGLAPRKRGPKVTPPDPRDRKIVELERETRRWKARAGVLKSKKGVEFLLNAFVRLRDVLPNSTFVVVGDIIERERHEFTSLVNRYELGGNLQVTGMVVHREMLRYMRCMDVFPHASLYDGCPNVVLEAFVAGVPVVATRAGAVPELIDDGVNGLLVETPITMAEAAFALVRDGSSEMVAAAQRRAATQFLPSREADQFAEIYRSVIRRQTTTPRQGN